MAEPGKPVDLAVNANDYMITRRGSDVLMISFDGVSAFIREVMQSAPYRRVLCIGQSSGGYGALRFALDIEPHACLAFAPQTRSLAADHRPLNPPAGFNLSRPPDELEDLAQMYSTQPHPFRVQIRLCNDETDNPADAYFWDDWAHVAAFRDIAGVEVVSHRCSSHPVAESLTETEELDRVVLSILADC